MADVFVSFARRDRDKAEQVKNLLKDLGLTVFFDIEGLDGGDVFPDVLDEELGRCGAVIGLWSPYSLTRRWVKIECSIGLERGVLIPAAIEPLDKIPANFHGVHFIDMVKAIEDKSHPGWHDLIRALARTLDRPELLEKAKIEHRPEAAERRQGPRRPEETATAEPGKTTAPEAAQPARAFKLPAWLGSRPYVAVGAAAALLLAAAAGVFLLGREQALGLDANGQKIAYGKPFTECPGCPSMVAVKPGRFTLGAESRSKFAGTDEFPSQQVKLAHPIAVGVTEVTVEEYQTFVEANNYVSSVNQCFAVWREAGDQKQPSWTDPGFSQDKLDPVVCVSWKDAAAYAAWVSEMSGQPYRLLSEAEWEYVAVAGDSEAAETLWQTPALCQRGNVADQTAGLFEMNIDFAKCNDREAYTARTMNFEKNAFGLYDLIGNVTEWVQDCYSERYDATVQSGAAYESQSCGMRVARGSSWESPPAFTRAKRRDRSGPDTAVNSWGFRLARDLGAQE